MFNLKSLRIKQNITQVELANVLGIKQSTLSDWENHKIAPKAERLPDIAKALNCTIDELFNSETTQEAVRKNEIY